MPSGATIPSCQPSDRDGGGRIRWTCPCPWSCAGHLKAMTRHLMEGKGVPRRPWATTLPCKEWFEGVCADVYLRRRDSLMGAR